MIVNLKFLNGNSKEITITPGQTIQDIKVEHLNLNTSNLDEIKIIYSGKILDNQQIVDDLGINDKSFFVILTTTKSALESLTSNKDDASVDTISSDSDSDDEIIDSDLFDLKTTGSLDQELDDTQDKSKEEEQIQEIDYAEVIRKNNTKFMELSQDSDFNILINIILNKPEYLNYALKFVQSGMIFNRPKSDDSIESTSDYSTELDVIKNLNIIQDTDKINKALNFTNGDIQMAIRYIFMSKFDENYEI